MHRSQWYGIHNIHSFQNEKAWYLYTYVQAVTEVRYHKVPFDNQQTHYQHLFCLF